MNKVIILLFTFLATTSSFAIDRNFEDAIVNNNSSLMLTEREKEDKNNPYLYRDLENVQSRLLELVSLYKTASSKKELKSALNEMSRFSVLMSGYGHLEQDEILVQLMLDTLNKTHSPLVLR